MVAGNGSGTRIANSKGKKLPTAIRQVIENRPKATMAGRRMAGATGLEPATFGVTGRRSNQLSYAPAGALRS